MRITAFIRYDLYPYYTVSEGDLHENFDVKTVGGGTYHSSKVLHIRPAHELMEHQRVLNKIKKDYDTRCQDLQLDLLREHGITFTKLSLN